MTRIRREGTGPVARLILDRPEKKNALDALTLAELHAALEGAGRDAAVRVIAIEGKGRDFCAGADLEALGAMIDASPKEHRRDAESLARVFRRLRSIDKPIVAIVRGRALAGGCGLATACDIVVAAESASFGYPEVRVGFVPAMVMTMLRRLVGERRAADLVLTGRVLDAKEALAIGLISRVVPDASLDADAERLLVELAAMPPGALARTKRLLYDLDELGFDEGLTLGAERNVEARMTGEFRDGLQRFLARRKET